MVATGHASPAEVAAIMLANPAARAEILTLLHGILGNTFVSMIVQLAHDFAHHDGGAEEAHLGPVKIVARRLRVRTTPTTKTDDNIIGSLKRGTVVTALEKEDAWLRIEYNGQRAYIHSGYAAPVDAPAEKKPKNAAAIAEDEEASEATDVAPPAAKTPPSAATTPAADPWAHAASNDAPAAPATAAPDATNVAPSVNAAPTSTPATAAPATTAPPATTNQAPTPTPNQAPTPAPNQAPTNAGPTNAQANATPAPNTAPAPVTSGNQDLFAKIYTAGTKGHTQLAQVFVSPGGITDTPDIFLFFHGHDANLGIDKKLKGGNLSGIDAAKEAMEKARGKNTVAILPQGVKGGGAGGGEKEGGYMPGLHAGLPAFIDSILTPLAADLGMAQITPGHIGIAGHSAGGYMGVRTALAKAGDLADNISDVTLMDTSYSLKHFKETSEWMVDGPAGKTVRIIGTTKQIRDKERSAPTWKYFSKSALDATAKAHGMTVQDMGGVGDKREDLMKVVQHSRLNKGGDVQVDILILEYNKTGSALKDHHPLRDEVMDDALMSVGDGPASNDTFGQLDHGTMAQGPEDDHDDLDVTAVKPPTNAPAKEVVAPTPAPTPAPTVKPEPTKTEPAKTKQDAAPKKEAEPFVPQQQKGKLDAYGNTIDRKKDRVLNKVSDHTFTNPFTVVGDGSLFSSGGKLLKEKLEIGTTVHVGEIKGARVQIITQDYSADDDVWMNFTSLGGKGSDVGLGNEKVDPEDKARADHIREGLPSGRKPGQSKFKWGFSSKHKPSLDGVALSGSLMSKVHALMEWAIHNDMVLGDIKIGSGMRPVKSAHYMCVRYEIANMDRLNRVQMSALKALPNGRDEDGNKWYESGWSEQDVIEYARKKIKAEGAAGKPAAAGYVEGNSRRLPLPLNGRPGVSRHCSGNAVDVDIPWRSAKDPNTVDLWGWEHVYHQFGLTRPLHRSVVANKADEESWHVEETGKNLAPSEGEERDDNQD